VHDRTPLTDAEMDHACAAAARAAARTASARLVQPFPKKLRMPDARACGRDEPEARQVGDARAPKLARHDRPMHELKLPGL
jgi:hypothetical protein